MTEWKEVKLPADLCSAAEKEFAHSFRSLEELLTFVLRDLLRNDAAKSDLAEQELVEQRLRELGYL